MELPRGAYHAARRRGLHMKIKETLQRDPATHALVNQGQARIADRATDREVHELMDELATFVCEGEYAEGMQRILSSFLTSQSQTSQKAAWVSGFFGSGKSHLLKMLCHLWQDTKFPDGSTARGLVPSLPEEIRALLRELDTQGKRTGGLLAAAGAMPGGTTDNVRLTVLSVLLRGAGFPEQYAQARFVLWLHEREYFDQVRAAVEHCIKIAVDPHGEPAGTHRARQPGRYVEAIERNDAAPLRLDPVKRRIVSAFGHGEDAAGIGLEQHFRGYVDECRFAAGHSRPASAWRSFGAALNCA